MLILLDAGFQFHKP